MFGFVIVIIIIFWKSLLLYFYVFVFLKKELVQLSFELCHFIKTSFHMELELNAWV